MLLIEKILRERTNLHLTGSFLRGTGRRMSTIRDENRTSLGQGSTGDVLTSFQEACENYMAGGEYIYCEDQFSAEPHNPLDAWIVTADTMSSLKIFYDRHGEQFVVKLLQVRSQHILEEISVRVRAGETVYWYDRGYAFESSPATNFDLGRIDVYTRVISSSRSSPAWAMRYKVCKTGEGATLSDAVNAALRAPEYEVES